MTTKITITNDIGSKHAVDIALSQGTVPSLAPGESTEVTLYPGMSITGVVEGAEVAPQGNAGTTGDPAIDKIVAEQNATAAAAESQAQADAEVAKEEEQSSEQVDESKEAEEEADEVVLTAEQQAQVDELKAAYPAEGNYIGVGEDGTYTVFNAGGTEIASGTYEDLIAKAKEANPPQE